MYDMKRCHVSMECKLVKIPTKALQSNGLGNGRLRTSIPRRNGAQLTEGADSRWFVSGQSPTTWNPNLDLREALKVGGDPHKNS
jgi:hypothetical protein